jgi:phage terminase Nu1 subunit (DNA packaging protein)
VRKRKSPPSQSGRTQEDFLKEKMKQSIQAQPELNATTEPEFHGVFIQLPLSVHQKLLASNSKQPQAYPLLMEVLRRIGSSQTQKVGQQKLAEALGVSLRTVQGTLSWLEAEGYLASRYTGKAKAYSRGTLLVAYSEAERAAAQGRKQAKAASRYAADCVADTQPIAQGTKGNNSLSNTNKQPSQKQAPEGTQSVFVVDLVREINKGLAAGQQALKASSLKAESLEAFTALEATLTAAEAAQQLLKKAEGKAEKVAGWLNSSGGVAAAQELSKVEKPFKRLIPHCNSEHEQNRGMFEKVQADGTLSLVECPKCGKTAQQKAAAEAGLTIKTATKQTASTGETTLKALAESLQLVAS